MAVQSDNGRFGLLNSHAKQCCNGHPVERLKYLFASVAGRVRHYVQTMIDLTKAFHKVWIEPNQRQFYGITQGRGPTKNYYRYKKMPMGVSGAPRCFHYWMKAVLDNLTEQDRVKVQHYQDDIIIAGDNSTDLEERYERVSDLVSKHSKINESKSQIGRIINVLGLEFDNFQRVIRLPQEKKEALQKAYAQGRWDNLLGMIGYSDIFLPLVANLKYVALCATVAN